MSIDQKEECEVWVMKWNKRTTQRVTVTLILVLIILVGQLFLGSRNMSLPENVLGGLANWVNRGLSTVYSIFVNTEKTVVDKRSKLDLIEENEALHAEVDRLQQLIDDSPMLKNEQAFREANPTPLYLARVIGKEPGNWFQRITINCGSTDGIMVGDTVVTAVALDHKMVVTGLVGRVSEVGLDWAKVNTVLDEDNGASFYNTRTLEGGFVESQLEDQLLGYMYDDQADVIAGDRLFTSGLGGVYQPDIYLGTVTDLGNDEGGMVKKVTIEPGVNFHKLARVFVMVPENR